MLQSVPDPFDSYGQPHSEDQIFSILPPLSILAPSPSSSSLAATPQTVASQAFATGTTAEWAQAHGSNGALYYDAAPSSSEWADAVPSSSASSSLLTTPTKPRSSSPPRRPNRPSSPPGTNRRAESKLRSVLSVIDEGHPRSMDDPVPSDSPGTTETTVAAAVTRNGPAEARNFSASWLNFPFGVYPRSGSQDTTPRSSSVSRSASPTPDADASPETLGRQTPDSDRTTLPISS